MKRAAACFKVDKSRGVSVIASSAAPTAEVQAGGIRGTELPWQPHRIIIANRPADTTVREAVEFLKQRSVETRY
jgi:hypothetical protein